MKRYRSGDSDALTISAANLNELDGRQSDLFECRMALIKELVRWSPRISADDPDSLDTIKELYQSIRPHSTQSGDLSEYADPAVVNSFFNAVSVIEKLEICRNILEDSKETDNYAHFLPDSGEDQSNDEIDKQSIGRIAYMKNNYTESAFLKFSKAAANARSAYFQSFEDVCEEVYSGSCEFCILPIESSSEGRLNSFYSMIDRYELKIAATCMVDHHDSQRFTRFALLRKSLREITHLRTNSKDQIFEFKCTLQTEEASLLGDILSSSRACRLQLIRIDSLPLPYNDKMISFYVSMNVNGGDLLTFLAYLTLEIPQCELLGVYYAIK